jgi:osmoprotectant transport system ATP-binding protein
VIAFKDVSVAYNGRPALSGVTLALEPGALCVLVGPSGSGKSTLLRLANRLVTASAGRVFVRGQDVSLLEPALLRRSIGYVMQSIGLFPHRTVGENIATVPRLLGWSKKQIAARVEAMLDLVHLGGIEFLNRYPSELSGGQAQRVGLARALAGDPDILLMDEPFGAVDPITRRGLRAELRRIHHETGKTVLLVTHDPAEALELATQIVVLRQGLVVAAGHPLDLTGPGGDAFTRDLFGGEALALRRLQFTAVADVMGPRPENGEAGPGTIAAQASLQEALARMVEDRTALLTVVDDAGGACGVLSADAVVQRYR